MPVPFLALLCLVAALLSGGRADAHAQLVAADPTAGAIVAEAPAAVTLSFSEPVRPLVARWFPSGGGAPVDVAPRPEGAQIIVPLPDGISSGTSVLSWRVVSADGHPVGGSHVFSIGEATAGDAAAGLSTGASAREAALGRGILTLALVLGAGGAVFLRIIDRSGAPSPAATRLALCAAVASPPLALLALGLQGLDILGLPAAGLFSAQAWSAAMASPFVGTAALAALAGVSAIVALRAGGAVGKGFALVAWGLAATSFALFGHAATAPPRWLTVTCVTAHAAAFIFWIGALPALAGAAARRDTGLSRTLHRFSAFAVPLVALLVLSGSVLAVVQVRHLSALIDTAYGRLLTVKLVAVALFLLLAVLNRFRLTPGIARGDRDAPARFRRSVVAEIVLGLLILALASGFRLTPPPRALAAVPTQVYVHLHGPTVMADLTLTPGRAGPNAVEVGIVSTDGAPLDPLEVRISVADPARGLEPIRVKAVREGEVWKAGPILLPYAGDWTIRLDVLVSDFEKATLEATATVASP